MTNPTPSVTAEGLSLDDLERLAKAATSTVEAIGWQDAHEADQTPEERRFRAIVIGDTSVATDITLDAVWKAQPVVLLRAATALRLISELRAAREVIDLAWDRLTELNEFNYTHDDVCEANAATVEVLLAIEAARTATEVKP